MFFIIDFLDIENYVNYDTPHNLGLKLQKTSVNILKWFYGNGMKTSQKLLGVMIDRKLNFNKHLTNLCDKTSKKFKYL